jgi:hypothetical protein
MTAFCNAGALKRWAVLPMVILITPGRENPASTASSDSMRVLVMAFSVP